MQATQNALQNSTSIVGVGITMEGIDQNPAYYALCLESAWMSATQAFDAAKWMVGWGRNRCGRATADVDRGEARRSVAESGGQGGAGLLAVVLPFFFLRAPWSCLASGTFGR